MKLFKPIHRSIIFIFLLLIPYITYAEYNINIGMEDFKLTEASKKHKERGKRYSLGVTTGTLLARPSGLFYELNANIYKGDVDYTLLTPTNPGKTSASYDGSNIEGKLAFRINHFDIAGTFGYDTWTRTIKNIKTKTGKIIPKTKEKFTQPYVKLGVGFFHYLRHDRARFEIGYKRPFDVGKINDELDLDLSSQGKDSVYAQYRYQSRYKWGLIIYSEKTHLRESNSVLINDQPVKQPENKTTAVGAKFTYRF